MKAQTVSLTSVSTYDETSLELSPEETEVLETILQSASGRKDVQIEQMTLFGKGFSYTVRVSRSEYKKAA